ncbi:MAG: hypothetical protein J0L73_26020 [Verrucomicrobia bacterium]|nr:hypothetical protein [Verrucomicrobiota bacterium]
MPRFTGFEYGILILGLCLVLVGAAMILHPSELDVARPGSAKLSRPATFEHVSKKGAVVAGGISALAGITFLAALFYRRGE